MTNNQMLREFEFRFTCINIDEACTNVKAVTKQVSDEFYEIKNIKNTWYDHIAFIKVPSIDEASIIRREIIKKSQGNLSSIIIRAR